MIIDLTRKTTKEWHNPLRVFRVKSTSGIRVVTKRIPQTEGLRIWKGNA